MRYCPECATRLRSTSSRGGIPRRECPECTDDRDAWGRYGGNCRQVVADGGRPGVTVGDWARDADSDDDDRLLVIREPGATADEVLIGDRTVAEYNPEYPPTARVLRCVYESALEERLDGWRSVDDVRDAVAVDAIPSYSFPAPRLRAVDEDGGGQLEAFL